MAWFETGAFDDCVTEEDYVAIGATDFFPDGSIQPQASQPTSTPSDFVRIVDKVVDTGAKAVDTAARGVVNYEKMKSQENVALIAAIGIGVLGIGLLAFSKK